MVSITLEASVIPPLGDPTSSDVGWGSNVGSLVTPLPGGPLTASITIGSNTYSFSQADATQVDDYVDPQGKFTQHCFFAAPNAGLPGMTVIFRPDADGSRAEVVFEYGDMTLPAVAIASITKANPGVVTTKTPHGRVTGQPLQIRGAGGMTQINTVLNAIVNITPTVLSPTTFSLGIDTSAFTAYTSGGTLQAGNLGAYTVQIKQGTALLWSGSLPQHCCFSRWRWMSAPRPIRTTIAALQAAGQIPYFDGSGLGQFTKPYAGSNYTPMGLAGLTAFMGQTGERGDIGMFTEWQADFICSGKNWNTVRAQCEACGTFPWFMRDPATRCVADPLSAKWLKASTYGGDVVNILSAFCSPDGLGKTQLNGDPAHEPELNFLPWLLTGDPYYLESWQAQDTYNTFVLPSANRYTAGGGPRAVAWSVRTVGRLAACTPANLPTWFLPATHFATNLENWLAYIDKSIASTAPEQALFQLIIQPGGVSAAGTIFDFWMSDFLTASLCDLFRLGQTTVSVRLAWCIEQVVSRCNGTSGWPRGVPTMYNTYLISPAAPTTPTSWASLFQNNVLTQPDVVAFDPTDPTGNAKLAWNTGAQITYFSYCRGLLALATQIGLVAAAPCFTWLDGQIRSLMPAKKQSPDLKWCFALPPS